MMNTEQIIKALECCSKCLGCEDCEDCPYYQSIRCNVKLMQDALALIDEQQAQIENLKKENKYLRESLVDERGHKEDMKGK